MRVIVGGVGYRNLRDHSVGVVISDRLMQDSIGPNVVVEDMSYNPIALVQRLQDETEPFDRVVLIAGVPRANRMPGAVTMYRWDGVLPQAEEVQRAVADAVTGIINVDNTAIVCWYFNALPSDVILVEIEPEAHEFGDTLSPPVSAAIEPAIAMVRRAVLDEIDDVPVTALGGGSRGPRAWH